MLLAFFYVSAPAAAAPVVDLVMTADAVVTMTEAGVISPGAVAIEGSRIVAVGSLQAIARRYPARRTITGEGQVLLPGLVNGHTHTGMTLFRGMVDDLELETWLTGYVFPMEGRFVTPEFIAVGSELACYEMIRGGTTSFVDMYFYPEVIAQVVDACGLRAVIAAPAIDVSSPGFEGWQDAFAAAEKFVVSHQQRYPRVTPGFGPHAPYTVAEEHLAEVAAASARLKAPVSIHVAEAPFELDMLRQRYQRTPLEHLARVGLLNERLIAAHVVHPDPGLYRLMAARGMGVVHNPTSNLKLASGVSPVVAMMAAGIKVGLGTDGAASNNDLDLFEEMRLAALLHKERTGDPTAVPALQALLMATAQGAAAVGLGDKVGVLAPGYEADLILVSLDSLRVQPVYDVVSHLVYVADSSDVTTTVVAGQVLMADRKVLSIDEATLRQRVAKQSARVRAVLGESAASFQPR